MNIIAAVFNPNEFVVGVDQGHEDYGMLIVVLQGAIEDNVHRFASRPIQPHSNATAIGRQTARRCSSTHLAFQDRTLIPQQILQDASQT